LKLLVTKAHLIYMTRTQPECIMLVTDRIVAIHLFCNQAHVLCRP